MTERQAAGRRSGWMGSLKKRERIVIAARTFAVATLLGLNAVFGDISLTSDLPIAAIAALATALTVARLPGDLIAVASGLVACVVIALAAPHETLLVPYVVVPILVASLYRGLVGVALVMVAEIAGLIGVALIPHSAISQQDASLLVLWLSTGLGMGLLGASLRSVSRSQPRDRSYEDARELLVQLHALSHRLSSGLDPITIAEAMMDLVRRELGAVRSLVLIGKDGSSLTPLRYSACTAPDAFGHAAELIARSGAEQYVTEPVEAGAAEPAYRIAFRLTMGTATVGALVAECPGRSPTEATLESVAVELARHTLRLDTALLFDDIRALATTEERHRLASEVHDGIAQDIAWLGYLVDDLVTNTADESHRERLREFRAEISKATNELRLSIFDLRTDVTRGPTLGANLSDYIKQVSAKSDVVIHLELDEQPIRLRVEVESALLRIAQEAITNARRHAHAQNLWVTCTVKPPFAQIEIRDDGSGLGPARADSYGLAMMRERADRIGARFDIRTNPEGTAITVAVGNRGASLDAASRKAIHGGS